MATEGDGPGAPLRYRLRVGPKWDHTGADHGVLRRIPSRRLPLSRAKKPPPADSGGRPRSAHNPSVAGSNPARPTVRKTPLRRGCLSDRSERRSHLERLGRSIVGPHDQGRDQNAAARVREGAADRAGARATLRSRLAARGCPRRRGRRRRNHLAAPPLSGRGQRSRPRTVASRPPRRTLAAAELQATLAERGLSALRLATLPGTFGDEDGRQGAG